MINHGTGSVHGFHRDKAVKAGVQWRIHWKEELEPTASMSTNEAYSLYRGKAREVVFMENMSMHNGITSFLECMKKAGLELELRVLGERRTSYYYQGDYYIGPDRVSERVMRRCIQIHYTGSHKDWAGDLSYIEGQLKKVRIIQTV
jgi:hypothetical protein